MPMRRVRPSLGSEVTVGAKHPAREDGVQPGAEQWYGGPVRDRRPASVPRGAGRALETGAVRCGPVWAVVPPGAPHYPPSAIDAARGCTDDAGMEVIQSSHAVRRPSMAPLLSGTVIGTILIVTGIVMAWVALATPLLSTVLPSGRLNVGQMATGVVVWSVALVGPAACVLIGASRLVRILASLRERTGRRSATMKALDALPDDMVVASGLTLGDGRGVALLVLGPFGAAVLRDLPPAPVTRIRDGRWELKGRRGWITLENPLERATRDAERVRRWLGHDDADFIVKVYAAVVGTGWTIPRTSECAVLTPDEVTAWITALPPQRSLTEGRREQIVDLVRETAGYGRSS